MAYLQAAFSPTEPFIVLLSAYFQSIKSDFLIIIPELVSISAPVVKYVKSIGGEIKTVSEATNSGEAPAHLWVHSFGKPHISKALIEHYNIEYSLYSDGIKNELGKASIEENFPNYKSVLFFGFVWKKSFIRNKIPIEICTFQDIKSAFDSIRSIVGIELLLDEKDLESDWLFLRYWGQANGAFVGDLEYIDVIKNYLSSHNISRVLLKGDSRIKISSTDSVLEGLSGDYAVASLENKVKLTKDDSVSADKFFAEVMLPVNFRGQLHCFDSSLSVYASVSTNADIMFPSQELVSEVFASSAFARNVISYTALYRSVCNKIKELKDLKTFDSSGWLVVERNKGEFYVRENHVYRDNTQTMGCC